MTQLSTTQLFIPLPSGVSSSGQPIGVANDGSWLGLMLGSNAAQFLPTTSWQSGTPERSILAIEAVSFALSDAQISLMAQGGFLQPASDGTVTYVTPAGTTIVQPVTPDPSNPAQNPTGAPGYLDLLTENVYGVTRLSQTAAAGPIAIVNLKGSSIGPYSALSYHVANARTGATYSNTSSLTIPSSAIAGTGGVVVGVTVGTSTVITTQSAHGLSAGQAVYISIPASSGVLGLAGVFALVASVTSTTITASTASSGVWTSGGTVYSCTIAQMSADVAGISGNAASGDVTTAVTQNAGVFVRNLVPWSGSNWESNPSLADRAVLSLAAASPNGPSQAYVFFAETAAQLLAIQPAPYVLSNGPVTANSFGVPATGTVTTVIASSTPASTTLGSAVTPGVSQLPISGVSNSNPCVITCSGPTTLAPATAMAVSISGVVGTGGVNGTFIGTYVSANSFSISVDTTLTGLYLGGGSVEGGDLGQIDQLLQRNVDPSGVTAVTVSALALPIAVVATVAVPQAYVATYQARVNAQLLAQINSYPIGGNPAPANSVAYNDILGALEEAGVLVIGSASFVRQVTNLTIAAPPGAAGKLDIPFPGNQYKAVLASATISVVGV